MQLRLRLDLLLPVAIISFIRRLLNKDASNEWRVVMETASKPETLQERPARGLERFTLITTEERGQWLLGNIFLMVGRLLAIPLVLASVLAVFFIDMLLSVFSTGGAVWILPILGVVFCSLSYVVCFYSLYRALTKPTVWAKSAQSFWPIFFFIIGLTYWAVFSATPAGQKFFDHSSSPLLYFFSVYFQNADGWTAFFLLGDVTAVYFYANLILWLLTVLYKSVRNGSQRVLAMTSRNPEKLMNAPVGAPAPVDLPRPSQEEAPEKIMESHAELDVSPEALTEGWERFFLITMEERNGWLFRNIIHLILLSLAIVAAFLSVSAVLSLDRLLSGASAWAFLALSVFFCSAAYCFCLSGIYKALTKPMVWARTARIFWAGCFCIIGVIYWQSFAATSLGISFCGYLASSPFSFLFDYLHKEGFVLFFIIGDVSVLYFSANLILWLLTLFLKILAGFILLVASNFMRI
jgi:hypothetical protein